MGLNILVGHTGLVSFGHGAWFGLGAYAAALSQRYWFPGEIVLPALFSIAFVAVAASPVGRADPAPARRLFLAAHAGAHRAAVRHRLSLDRVHRRRERARRRDARHACSASISNTTRSTTGWSRRSLGRSRTCSGASTARRSAACWWRSARTSSARASSAIRPTATSSSASCCRRRWSRSPGCCRCSITASPRPSRSPSPSRASSSPWW